jgi:hypothetical protein
MDRAFKREFREADPLVAARLAQLYKQRLAPGPVLDGAIGDAKAGRSGSGGGGSGLGQLDWIATAKGVAGRQGDVPAAVLLGRGAAEVLSLAPNARPEGMEAAAWERFVEFRAERAQLEAEAREEAGAAARAGRWVELLEARRSEAAARSEAAESEAAALEAARHAACNDVELRFRLTAGQVEAEHEGVAALLAGAVMVPRSRVEELNDVVRTKGRQKLEVLAQMKEFKRGMCMLQWENKRCAGVSASCWQRRVRWWRAHVCVSEGTCDGHAR